MVVERAMVDVRLFGGRANLFLCESVQLRASATSADYDNVSLFFLAELLSC